MFLVTIYKSVILISLWLIFGIAYFNVFRHARLERLFKQGDVGIIRLAYFLLTITLSFICAYGFYLLFLIFTGQF